MTRFAKAENEARLTAERLRDVLSYDADTGEFRWRVARGNSAAGSLAGSPERKGYVRINVDGTRFKAHRLAWLYVHGRWPSDQIDHVNGDPADNRICNLREASNALNAANARCPKNSQTGLKGVTFAKGEFVAAIKRGYRRVVLGRFRTADEAAAAYDAAAISTWGDRARPNNRRT